MMILFTVMGALARLLGLCSLGKVSIGNAVIVLLQILFSGIVVIYLDDILKKGYGLLSSVSLFTATTIWYGFETGRITIELVYPCKITLLSFSCTVEIYCGKLLVP